jgi:hypothetical protein
MQEERFSHELESYDRDSSLEAFMMFYYKTTFCPYINHKHEWSDCNYAHRQQDFRRAPQSFYYLPEKCGYISEDGSWDQCPNELDCEFSHSLLESIYHPSFYRQSKCPDTVDNKPCYKRGDLCSLFHAVEEKTAALIAITGAPKEINSPGFLTMYLDQVE